jgi:hypothetical protein
MVWAKLGQSPNQARRLEQITGILRLALAGARDFAQNDMGSAGPATVTISNLAAPRAKARAWLADGFQG